jgi:ATP-binding protein involved in chromosome partitioning
MLRRPDKRERVAGVDRLVVVGSGKGGVGKSTACVNLAVALVQLGLRVGLLDADAYGPSVPMMLGVRKRADAPAARAQLPLGQRGGASATPTFKPLTRYGVEIMSVGFFIGEQQAVVPMPEAQGILIRQLLHSVDWGALDMLLIDLPPGTGEPQATLCRDLALEGAVLVTTPQDIARIDAAKAAAMFERAGVPVLGLIENMSGFICPHCGERTDIFPRSAEPRPALDVLPLLAAVPLDPATAARADAGQPSVVAAPEAAVAQAFLLAARQLAALDMREPPANMQDS